MLVIYRRNYRYQRNNGGMTRYYKNGDGLMVDELLQKSGIKADNLLSSAHKVIDAVVDGTASASKKVADSLIDKAGETSAKLVNKAVDSLINKVVRKRKVKQQPQEQPVASLLKKRKLVNSFIDKTGGSGIVFD